MTTILLRAVALSLVMLITACEGRLIGRNQAREYFNSHRADFDRLLEQVGLCKPLTGRIERDSDFECHASGGNARAVTAALIAVDATWMRVSYTTESKEQISRIWVAMHSEGFSFAGIIEAYIYEAEAAAEASYERTDDGFADIQQMPVTDAPHHWYWQHMRRR